MLNSEPLRKKILISAYAISPYLGSEYGVAWNFVTKLNAFYDVTVLYGTSSERMGNNAEMLEYIENNSIDVDCIYVRPNMIVMFFDWLNRNVNSIFFATSYSLWQRQVLRAARKLTNKTRFDLVHHLGTTGFRQPGFLWKLNLPFVWGPAGGTSNLNRIFFPLLSKAQYFRHLVRNISNLYFLRFSLRLRRIARESSAIFCATQADQENFKKYFNVECSVIRENSIRSYASTVKKTESHLNFVWVGWIDERKALNLLIESLAMLGRKDDWKLHVVGNGPTKEKCMALSQALGLSGQIVWHGSVKREQVVQIIRNSDVHIISSLMEGLPTVLLEAFEVCVPTISLDHCGMKDLIDADIGFKIKITTLNEVVSKFTECLNHCLDNPEMLDSMKMRILEKQSELHWDRSIDKVRAIYEEVISDGKFVL